MIASGLLDFRRCCALGLECKSHVGIVPICVSSEGRLRLVVLKKRDFLHLFMLVGRHPVYLDGRAVGMRFGWLGVVAVAV